jgi:hypothetical protein
MSAEDFTRGLELPVTVVGCELVPGPDGTFDLRSRGPLGGIQRTLFAPEGDTARIVSILGWIGDREPEMPFEQHVEALRDLGFIRLIAQSGKPYELGA